MPGKLAAALIGLITGATMAVAVSCVWVVLLIPARLQDLFRVRSSRMMTLALWLGLVLTALGNGAGFTAGIGYLGQKQQTVDMNLVVNHWGQKTTSEINAAGTLKDDAQKIFRGTIDFKKGSTGSVGSEQETVLMLGDGVVNKTVPLILCAEENVVGNHGATIGELDEDTLFYFESRGISAAEAENIMARAAIERLARTIEDEAAQAAILSELEEVL